MASVTFEKDNVDVIDKVLTPADFDANGNWHTDSINSLNVSRVSVLAKFAELTPDGKDNTVQYRLQVSVQGKNAFGEWEILAKQLNSLYSSENAMTRKIIASESSMTYEPGQEHFIPDALGNEDIGVSYENTDVPDEIRVCISLREVQYNPPEASLTSFKLTLTGLIN